MKLTNIVLMGMGEPLANMDAVGNATAILLKAFGLSKRRITLSTSGVIPQLEKFAEKFAVKIAISLNATTDDVRSRLMPINRRYPIAEIMKFCRAYSKTSKHRVTFEYVLIKDVNDTKEDVKRLIDLFEGVRAKVNLIPFNPFPESGFERPDDLILEKWYKFLTEKGVQTNIRVGRGQDILAACGQLAS